MRLSRKPLNPRKFRIIETVLVALVFVSFAPINSQAQSDFMPPEIKNIQLGMSSAQVLDMIKNAGEHTTVPVTANAKRTKLVWPLANNMCYKQVEFEFTEKDRLYLLRFVLNDELKWNLTSLKKQFFDKYSISWDDPGRMRVKNLDVILYIPDQGKWHFFEMRDITTGQKSFELFDQKVSAQDRRAQKTEDDAAKQAESRNSAPSGQEPSANSKNKTPEPLKESKPAR